MCAAEEIWRPAPPRPVLEEGSVHVWRAELDREPAALRALRETLAPDERERADRFKFERDRRRFVSARGALRDILGQYLGVPPERVGFSYGPFGKPSLAGESHRGPLHFNVSHSQGLALYAVSAGREVGLDLEWVREDFASLEVAEQFFSPAEVRALRGLAPGLRTAAFFDCWTRKEAYIKALGEGLSHPLHRFTVELAPGRPAALLLTEDDPEEARRWSLVSLSPGAGFAGALAVKGPPPRLTCWGWGPPV